MRKLFSGKVDPYWAIGVPATAPVPWLTVVKAVLWVINTLHDPGGCYGIRLPPVPHNLARYDADAISARLLMYSWVRTSVPHLVPLAIGESCIPPVDKYTIYDGCSGPCSHAKSIYGHYLWSCSCSIYRSAFFL